MNLKSHILKLARTCISLSLLFSPSCLPHEGQVSISTSENISQDAFRNCDFQFKDTTHITHIKSQNNGLILHQDGICSFNLSINGFYTLGDADVNLMIVNQNGSLIEQAISYSGFKRKPDSSWYFYGHSFSAGKLLKYQKLSYNVVNNDHDITLIGSQLEHGTDQKGTPITFDAIHVLRISAAYAISVNIPFDIGTPPSTRDEVVKDIVQLVNSVQPTALTATATSQ